MFWQETLGAGIHVNATWHALPIQTLLRTKYSPWSQQHYPMAVALEQDSVPRHTANTAQEQLKGNKVPTVLTGPTNSGDPNLIKHL